MSIFVFESPLSFHYMYFFCFSINFATSNFLLLCMVHSMQNEFWYSPNSSMLINIKELLFPHHDVITALQETKCEYWAVGTVTFAWDAELNLFPGVA